MNTFTTANASQATIDQQALDKAAAAKAKAAKGRKDRAAAKAALNTSATDPVLEALKESMNDQARADKLHDKRTAKQKRDAAKAAAEAKALKTAAFAAAVQATAPKVEQKAAVANLKKAIKEDAKSPTMKKITANSIGAMAASLSADDTAKAKAATHAAINKAKGAPSVKPADNARYTVGAYKGRQGAMFEFMKRVGKLGDAFSREQMIASCIKSSPHKLLVTRAQVLDYFAWAVRHGLLIEAAPAKAPAKAAKKAAKGKEAKGLSRLLSQAMGG